MWQLVAAAIMAAVQTYQTKKGLEAQAETDARNIREQYASQAEQERQVQEQNAEQMTDRMRLAHRNLSMARVLAAEGAGGLRGRAENILASANEDMARLASSRDSAVAGIRGDQNAARVMFDGRRSVIKQEGRNNQVRFFSSLASSAMGAYTSNATKAAETRAAQGMTSDYTDPDKYQLTSGRSGSIRFGS